MKLWRKYTDYGKPTRSRPSRSQSRSAPLAATIPQSAFKPVFQIAVECVALVHDFLLNLRAVSTTELEGVDGEKRAGHNSQKTPSVSCDLLQLRRDRRELGVELCADAVHGGNDDDGNASGDQAVFDCRGSGIAVEESFQLRQHGHPRKNSET